MKTLIWIQGKSDSDDSILSCNGARINKYEKEYQEYFDFLVAKGTKPIKKDGEFTIFKVKSDSKFAFIIHSNFNETDVANRNVAYLAYAKADNLEVALQNLKNEAALYGYTCQESDMDRIKEIMSDNKKDKQIYIVLLIVIILIIVNYATRHI